MCGTSPPMENSHLINPHGKITKNRPRICLPSIKQSYDMGPTPWIHACSKALNKLFVKPVFMQNSPIIWSGLYPGVFVIELTIIRSLCRNGSVSIGCDEKDLICKCLIQLMNIYEVNILKWLGKICHSYFLQFSK